MAFHYVLILLLLSRSRWHDDGYKQETAALNVPRTRSRPLHLHQSSSVYRNFGRRLRELAWTPYHFLLCSSVADLWADHNVHCSVWQPHSDLLSREETCCSTAMGLPSTARQDRSWGRRKEERTWIVIRRLAFKEKIHLSVHKQFFNEKHSLIRF